MDSLPSVITIEIRYSLSAHVGISRTRSLAPVPISRETTASGLHADEAIACSWPTRGTRSAVRTQLMSLLYPFISCVTSVILEQRSEWTAGIADPSTCTRLDLHSSNTGGTIPSTIGTLTALQTLCVLDDGREPICPPHVSRPAPRGHPSSRCLSLASTLPPRHALGETL